MESQDTFVINVTDMEDFQFHGLTNEKPYIQHIAL